jgi:hypothetical protein
MLRVRTISEAMLRASVGRVATRRALMMGWLRRRAAALSGTDESHVAAEEGMLAAASGIGADSMFAW